MLLLTKANLLKANYMNKYLPLILICLFINSTQVFADGYIYKDIATSNIDLILDFEVDLLPGFKEKQNQKMGAYLVNPNTFYTNIEAAEKNELTTASKNSLQALDEIEVARGNLLKVKFDHIWMVKK